jgi:Peptidase A4 family
LKRWRVLREFMRPGPFWLIVAVLAMVGSALSPGLGAAVATVSPTMGHPVSASAAVTRTGAYNWAGYVAGGASGTVTQVSGTWVQPVVNCTKPGPSYLATWVGIDGFNTSDLVQTGTGAACSGGSASYNAWWEVLPASERVISSIPVHAGDKIQAYVSYSASSKKFTMTIADGTHSFSKTETVSSTMRNAAECIVERPEVGRSLSNLAKFKTDRFSSCTATIAGVTGGIGTFSSVFEIEMVNNNDTKVIGAPSGLTGGKTFHVTWKGYS